MCDKDKLSRFWCVTRTNGPDADSASQWDTKRKLISLVEVCALPRADLVVYIFPFNKSYSYLNSELRLDYTESAE